MALCICGFLYSYFNICIVFLILAPTHHAVDISDDAHEEDVQFYKTHNVKDRYPKQPNFVILLADDFGYGDLRSFGNFLVPSNEIDQLAYQGIRFKNFYSGSSLCSPARASLLTGRLPARTGAFGRKDQTVWVPFAASGLPFNEVTMAEQLKSLGYRTGMVGKWHLGINQYLQNDGKFLPKNHGFDFVGINLPFTNAWFCDQTGVFMPNGPDTKRCFLYNGTQFIQQPINHEGLTDHLLAGFNRFVDSSIAVKKPFFFYFSFPQTHTDLFRDDKFVNSSKSRGLYGDNLNEMAWAVGQVLKKLKSRKVDQNTLVVFTSDHGPHIEICKYGGSSGGLKGGKTTTFEGGFRTPTIAWWPSVIRPGQLSSAVLNAMDLYPTFVHLANGEMPANLTFDGQNEIKAILGIDSKSRFGKIIYYYCGDRLLSVRYKNYKVHYYHQPLVTEDDMGMMCPGGIPMKQWYVIHSCYEARIFEYKIPVVYNLLNDPGELMPLVENSPTVLSLLRELRPIINKHRHSVSEEYAQPLFDRLNPALRPCCNPPKCRCNYP